MKTTSIKLIEYTKVEIKTHYQKKYWLIFREINYIINKDKSKIIPWKRWF